jgi:hypothetical protein
MGLGFLKNLFIFSVLLLALPLLSGCMSTAQGVMEARAWAVHVADNMDLLPKDSPPDKTVYCYKTLADVVCYDEPQAGQESRLVAFHEAEPPQPDTSLLGGLFGLSRPAAPPPAPQAAWQAPAAAPAVEAAQVYTPPVMPPYIPPTPTPVQAVAAAPLSRSADEAFDAKFDRELEADIVHEDASASVMKQPSTHITVGAPVAPAAGAAAGPPAPTPAGPPLVLRKQDK